MNDSVTFTSALPDNSTTIHISYLPATISEADVVDLFSPCGPISFLRIIGQGTNNTQAFVEFVDEAGYQAAFAFNGMQFSGGTLRIDRATNKGVKPPRMMSSNLKGRLEAALQSINRKVEEREGGAGTSTSSSTALQRHGRSVSPTSKFGSGGRGRRRSRSRSKDRYGKKGRAGRRSRSRTRSRSRGRGRARGRSSRSRSRSRGRKHRRRSRSRSRSRSPKRRRR
eukprot:NODE_1068_length_1131_cov_213.538817_g816_i0.p1 GENE.NODE_1068_length_1131_cov_213.538817_g816_i0~~NODE_1068_length_1131_cov_213.538817_g816_i0.p1  ORF type:complete len:225 (-),score=38.34 NODE_1068_length_1131_cov_213.538817_g816_i0:333-1007(-)